MTTEKLERAKYLEIEIIKYDLVVDNLKRDIDFIEKGSTYDKAILTMSLDYSEYSLGTTIGTYNRKVAVKIPKEILLKITNTELYVANNLLKKYKLELDKL